MIVLLGATGYVGQAFQRELQVRGEPFLAVSRKELDYTRYEVLVGVLRDLRPHFLINAAGYTGRPNVDACELAKADTLQGNTLFPLTVSHACQAAGIPWGHVSSGCIYAGAKIREHGETRVERDLTRPAIREVVQQRPACVEGFRENDPPNFTFRHPPCSFYSGTKALAEEALSHDESVYVWRLRIPFDEHDNARNYLTKLQRYAKLYENFNSLSHRADFVGACLDLWKLRAPFGTYNVTNPGFVSTQQVAEKIRKILDPERVFEYWADDEEFYRKAVKTPRSNCVLNVDKIQAAGVSLRPVEEALQEALENWVPQQDSAASHQPATVPNGSAASP